MEQQKYVMAAIDAALKAGGEILSIYDNPDSDFEIERKADNSPLTVADRKAHDVIVSILGNTSFPILSEEGKKLDYMVRREWETLWIVDPLDGTKEFIKRNGEFTVNIALVKNSVLVLGVIYIPVKRYLYFAVEGMGAYKISGITTLEDDSVTLEQIIKDSERLPLDNARNHLVVVASRSHLSPETEAYITNLKHKHHGGVELISSGSSIKICLVAEGQADVYPRFAPTMEWDTAAGHAIARAAGMKVYQAGTDEPLQYNKEDLLNPWFIVEGKGELLK